MFNTVVSVTASLVVLASSIPVLSATNDCKIDQRGCGRRVEVVKDCKVVQRGCGRK
jgi:hypothetical protein